MWEGGHTVRRPRAPAGRGSGLYVCSLVHFNEGAACMQYITTTEDCVL